MTDVFPDSDQNDNPVVCDCRAKRQFQDELQRLIKHWCVENTITHGALIEVLACETLAVWHESQHAACHDADPHWTPPNLRNEEET